MIEISHLVKKYGSHTAVDDLSFSVKKGQIYGFLGPNGAGKSTTMNIITGYLAATSGQVIVNGHDILKEPEEAKKSIGYLPEMPPLYLDMTVREYMEFAAQLKKLEKGKRAQLVKEAMDIARITDVQGRLIRNLSKGYRQRVGLAQAVLGFPEIIILDEPTVGLDPRQIIEIRDVIRELSARHTVILSSHILSEVSAVCDYILILSAGKLVASDTTENLMRSTGGNGRLELIIKGSRRQAEQVVKGLQGITDVVGSQGAEPGTVKLSVSASDGGDIREALFYHLAEHKLPILSMQSGNSSLEDIFLKLTAAEKAADEAEEEMPEETEGEMIEENVAEAGIDESLQDESRNLEQTEQEVKSDDSDL